ncbi:MAG: quinone-dependent dihydroorotate dehydrogenase [Pyrinomonadaceae bacterium]
MLYRSIIRPLLFQLPAESAHEFGLSTLRFASSNPLTRGFLSRGYSSPPSLAIERFGLKFTNPVGIAAGFDKNGVAARGLAALGFGFVEVGTVTHLPQPGNDKPRLFRLPHDHAVINRLGFNNRGAAALADRLHRSRPDCVLGVNIGKSKRVELENAVDDYLASFELVHSVADYVTINVSSPNTPNLRELQRPEVLRELLNTLQFRNRELGAKSGVGPVPLLVKIAPDLRDDELASIIESAVEAGLSGIIATNTTVSREGLKSSAEEVASCGAGGLSGRPLTKGSTDMIAKIYRMAGDKLTIVGVGGVFNAHDAWEKISAGASLIQIYTGMIYEGAGIARQINAGLAELLAQHGFNSLEEAVGSRTASDPA